MTVSRRIRVLVVDDSALVRKLLTDLLSSDPEIEVVGTAQDPLVARERIKQLNPDVLTLDVEMPRMDGVTFLRNLMRLRPMPVVMVSTLTEKGAEITLDALRYGAVDFITKPKVDITHSLQDYREELLSKVKMAATARVRQLTAAPSGGAERVPGQHRGGQGASPGPQAAFPHHRPSHSHWRIDRGDRGDSRGSRAASWAHHARNRDHAAHSGLVQRSFRATHESLQRTGGLRGS